MNDQNDTGFYWPVDLDAPRRKVRAGRIPADDHPRGHPQFVCSDRPQLLQAANEPSFWADAIDFYLPFLLVMALIGYAAGVYFLGWPIPCLS